MAKAKPRYKAKNNIRFNDVALHNQVVMLVGECNAAGNTKTSAGKALKKKEKTHFKFKFVDKKWAKENKLTGWLDGFTVDKKGFESFWEEVKGDDKSSDNTD